MTPVAQALARELLNHHAQACRPGRRHEECVIAYRPLCRQAGFPDIERGVGRYLGEIATWCAERQWPPLNSLAVNGDTHIPGFGYDDADLCAMAQWPAQVRECIDFEGYPDAV